MMFPAMSPASDTAGPAPEPADQAGGDHELLGSLELVARAQTGEREALDQLIRHYHDRIHRIARIRMGPRARAFMESRDLVQNTFLIAQRKLAEFQPKSHGAIIHWLASILQHQIQDANDYATAARRDPGRETPIDPGTTPSGDSDATIEPPSPDPGAATRASERELHEIYDACVQELDEDQREVILLRDYAGGSWEFIRDQLGRPTTDAAMQLYSRARARLARKVSGRVGEH